MDGSIRSYGNPYPIMVRYAPRENMIWFLEGLKYCIPLHRKHANEVWELYRVYEEGLHRQTALAENLSRISPAWTYYNAASALAGTDSNLYNRFMDQARRYREKLIEYSNSQKGLSTLSFFTTMKMDETLTFAELVEIETTQGSEAINDLKGRYWDKAEPLKDIPIFQYKPESLSESVSRVLPDIFIIVLLNIIFFMAAYASFMRQEVK